MKALLFLRGLIALPLIVLTMVVISLSIILGGCVAFCMPTHKLRMGLQKKLLIFPLLWGKANRLILLTGVKHKWDVCIPTNLSSQEDYLLIANHRSWVDILVLVSLFSAHTPAFKFFYKRELIWQVPFAGLAMWVLHYPHVARHSREKLKKHPHLKQKSIDELEAACAMLREAPTTTVNFAEGTRFTAEKHARKESPYKNLLPPKSQGIAMVVNALAEKLSGIIDVDILYTPVPSLWDLFCGKYKKITVKAHKLSADSSLQGNYLKDRAYRQHMRDWVTDVWEKKDKRLSKLIELDHE